MPSPSIPKDGEALTNAALDEVARLERQLAELADRHEITDLLYRFGASLDDRRFDEMRSLFVDAATVAAARLGSGSPDRGR
jgi:hypothetical protein